MERPSRVWIALAALVGLNLSMAASRLLPGIPMAVDSASHLYKLLFMYDNLLTHGYIPSWSPEWYGGIYLFKLYPPLSYQIALSAALAGLGPIASYKVVEVVFYSLTPCAVYLLSRELTSTKRESLVAALLFSLNPSIVENLLFYDRYPNILSLPIQCLLLALLVRSLKRESGHAATFFSSLLLASLTLIHHLSALYTFLTLAILMASQLRNGWWKLFRIVVAASALSILLSAFWVGPFLSTLSQLTTNPFYNRNVMESSHMKLTYFATHMVTYSFGVVPFTLAMVSLYPTSGGKRIERGVTYFFYGSLMAGLGLFEVSWNWGINLLRAIAQLLVASGFLSILYAALRSRRGVEDGFPRLWFLLFLWFSLGGYSVPFSTVKAIPYVEVKPLQTLWMSLDVQRFWLFMAIPTSLIASKPLDRLIQEVKDEFKPEFNARKALALLLLAVIAVGGGLKAYYSLTQPINKYLPKSYTTVNVQIPQPIVEYFKSQVEDGRILAVKCPFWIYLLPRYVGKQLVDGWYPQGKMLPRILEVNDYRINDLEASEDEDRIPTWKALIKDSDELAINWVMIGDSNRTFQRQLMEGSGFTEEVVVKHAQGEITIYRSVVPRSMVETSPPVPASIEHLAPDLIYVQLNHAGSGHAYTVKVKESYIPEWEAFHQDRKLSVTADDDGYIVVEADPWMESFTLKQKREGLTYLHVLSVAVLAAATAVYIEESRRRSVWMP
ncbi:MAG: 6-pyruvoyl-tetrahydropterin synthase-related protein [Candidatus Bathyarchaeia archaeon]